LAALVLYVTGAVTGGLVAWQMRLPKSGVIAKPVEKPPSPWWIQRPDFLDRMKHDLKLTDDQSQRIDAIIRKSRQRTDLLWEALREPLQEEMTQVKNGIRATLTAEQQVKFDELLKPKPWGSHSRRGPGKPGDDKPKFPGGSPNPGDRPSSPK
jgi:Spy/CpxP family protein refolding chaperone